MHATVFCSVETLVWKVTIFHDVCAHSKGEIIWTFLGHFFVAISSRGVLQNYLVLYMDLLCTCYALVSSNR